MRNRLLFIMLCLTLLFAGAVTLAAQEEDTPPAESVPVEEPVPDEQEKVALPDSPLVDEPEEEPAPVEPPAEEKKAAVAPMQAFLTAGSFLFAFNAGGILPLANFENSMSFGYELGVSVSYRFTAMISVSVLAEMVGISSADGGTSIGFYNLGVGLRAYLPLNASFYGWAQLGASGRTPDFTSILFGYHAAVCVGLLWAPDGSVELGVEYNTIYTQTDMYLKIFLAATFIL